MKFFQIFYKTVFFLYLLFLTSITYAKDSIVFAVFQYRDEDKVVEQYEKLADYLSEKLDGVDVSLRVLDAKSMLDGVKNKQIDIIFVNPNLYELIRNETQLNGITATVQRSYKNQTMSSLGGVIFTRNDAKIANLYDLQGKKVAIASYNHAGGYRIPLYELKQQEVDVDDIVFDVRHQQDAVVEAVLQGEVDAGFVRTGILESWLDNNQLQLGQIRVLNQRKEERFPHLLSTNLYPEWPIIVLPGLPDDLVRDIAVALFNLRHDHPAAIQAGISGFIAPQDYLGFENLLRELRLAPYDQNPVNLQTMWEAYGFSIAVLITVFLSILISLVLTEQQRRQIFEQKQVLDKQHLIDELLLKMPNQFESMNERDFMQYVMEEIEKLTNSEISFIHFLDEEAQIIELVAWSSNTTQNYCNVSDYQTHYPVDKAGVWAEAARLKKSLVINDYASYPPKKGMPEGHAFLQRMVSLPVLEQGKVVMLAGVGNKPTDYTEKDVDVIQLICNETWRLIKEHRDRCAIQSERQKFERLLDHLGEGYMVFSHNGEAGVLNYVSAGFTSLFEQPVFAVQGQYWCEAVNWEPESIIKGQESVKRLMDQDVTQDHIMLSFFTPSGKKKTIFIHQSGVYEGNRLIFVEGLVVDITKRVLSEQKIRQAASVFNAANEGIIICNNQNEIIQVNRRFEKITGYAQEEVIGKNPSILSSGHQDGQFYKKLWNHLLLRDSWEGELWNRRKNGEVYPERLKITIIRNENNEIEYFIALMADITFEKESQRKLEKMAHYDALTGLPNRFLLSDRISQAIANSHRENVSVSVYFVDLDGFKAINDEYGHPAGDYLLKVIGDRFQKIVREGDTVARIGGDEFVLVVVNRNPSSGLDKIERRLLSSSLEPVYFEGHKLQVSSSIGVAELQPEDQFRDVGSEQLIRLADLAMYQAKELGKNRIYHHTWDSLNSEFDVLEAIERAELEVYFQPKVNFKTQFAHAFEALIRWNHPSKGFLTPIRFLDEIERQGQTIELTEFVLDQALAFLDKIKRQYGQCAISINIDSDYLLQEGLVDKLQAKFSKFPRLHYSELTLELLESSSLGDMKQAINAIFDVRRMGIKFAIDDFGTGHASLNYLKNLPVDQVKIDQEFIKGVFVDPSSVSIIEAITSMAEAFDMEVIAEGAETSEHIELLLMLGVEVIQGYAISRPMDESTTLEWLQSWQVHPRWASLKELDSWQKQVLKAKLSISSWVLNIEKHLLHDTPLNRMELSPENCKFGKWLRAKESQKIFEHEAYDRVEILHHQLHELADEVIENKTDEKLMKQQLVELKEIKANLIELLDTISVLE
ncbi:EAL domain-containing protein [Thiomicrorhabdus sediminis]|nr:EAL domain-containing protein [Thiomicrorhabdus sediminis]